MAVTGIVAEFNPFHKGHKYLLDQASGLKIVVMSGNWLQRGEPAIIDKWSRASMAVLNGADLVVELPVLASVQSADIFAEESIHILAKLGIDNLVFGSESLVDYNEILRIYRAKHDEMEDFLASLDNNLSYPEKTQVMWEKFTGLTFTGDSPNHILALAYLKAISKEGSDIKLNSIQRQGQGFHSEKLEESQFASASAIRKNINSQEVWDFIPKNTHDILSKARKTRFDDYFMLLKYKILSDDLNDIFQLNEEIKIRLKREIKKAYDISDLVERVHTKRYTKSRIKRILVYILLNIKDEEFQDFQVRLDKPKVHLLAFSKKGQEYLGQIKGDVDLISRIGRQPWDKVSQRADEIYQLAAVDVEEQTFGRKPYIYK